jgi:hypothetical protein
MSKTPVLSAAVVGALALLFSFAPARSWGQRFLTMLRVQKVAIVPVEVPALTFGGSNSAFSKSLGQLISDNVLVTMRPGSPKPVSDPQAASEMAGFHARSLSALGTPQRISVTDEAAFQLTLDQERIQTVFAEAGRSDIPVPASIDGALIAVHIPRAVLMQYGTCPHASPAPSTAPTPSHTACAEFVQLPSPIVSVPPGLNVAALAEAGLELAGMNAASAHAFSQTVDWSSTLVIPLPQNISSYQTVPVDGVNGTLIEAPPHGRLPGGYTLIWIKNGIIYSLSGNASPDSALLAASSLS